MKRQVISIVLASAAVLGCDHGTTTRVYEWQGDAPADGWVHIRGTTGRVHVGRSPSDQIALVAQMRGSSTAVRRAEIRRVEEDDALVFCAMQSSRGTCSVERHSTRARRSFPFFRRESARIDITVMVPEGVKVNARTVNGGVRIERAPSDVVASTVNGQIDARVEAGHVEASSVNGNVRARIDSLPAGATVELSTVNGSVRAELPPTASGTVEMSTVNGSLTSDFALNSTASTRRRLEGVFGTPGAEGARGTLTLKTVNGSVQLARGS